MKHFVAYHNYERMDEESRTRFSKDNKEELQESAEDVDTDIDNDQSRKFGFLTRKNPERFKGNIVWWIVGQDKPRNYFLCGWFIVTGYEEVDRERFASRIYGSKGMSIPKGIYLNDESWFGEFKKANSNFSLGIQPIADIFLPRLIELVQRSGYALPPAEVVQHLEIRCTPTVFDPPNTAEKEPISADFPTVPSVVTLPERQLVTGERIIRDSALIREVKRLHDYHCQVCGLQLETPVGYYAEGAHLRQLGAGHDGLDSLDNLLCLCPLHHVMLDYGIFSIRDDLSLINLPGKLSTVPGHEVAQENLRYHRNRFGFLSQ